MLAQLELELSGRPAPREVAALERELAARKERSERNALAPIGDGTIPLCRADRAEQGAKARLAEKRREVAAVCAELQAKPDEVVAAVQKLAAVVSHAVPPLQDFARQVCLLVLKNKDVRLKEALPVALDALFACAQDAAAQATPDVEGELRALLGPEPFLGVRALLACQQAKAVPDAVWAAEDRRLREQEPGAAACVAEWVRTFDLLSTREVAASVRRVHARLAELTKLWRTLCDELGVDPQTAHVNTLLALARRGAQSTTMALRHGLKIAHQIGEMLGIPESKRSADTVLRALDGMRSKVTGAKGSRLLAQRIQRATGEEEEARVKAKVAAFLQNRAADALQPKRGFSVAVG